MGSGFQVPNRPQCQALCRAVGRWEARAWTYSLVDRVTYPNFKASLVRDDGDRATFYDRIWQAGAARGDLEAIAGRSRGVEAAALTDPGGLGAHRVLVLRRGKAG